MAGAAENGRGVTRRVAVGWARRAGRDAPLAPSIGVCGAVQTHSLEIPTARELPLAHGARPARVGAGREIRGLLPRSAPPPAPARLRGEPVGADVAGEARQALVLQLVEAGSARAVLR